MFDSKFPDELEAPTGEVSRDTEDERLLNESVAIKTSRLMEKIKKRKEQTFF